MAVGTGWLRKIWSKIWSRGALVTLLIVLGSIVLLVGSLTVWTKRQLLETDTWVETSSQFLENDDIRHAVAVSISRATFERADLASYLPEQAARLAPLLRGTLEQYAVQAADNFLQRPRVQELWRNANRRAHELFLKVVNDEGQFVSTAGGAVTLDLRSLVLRFAEEFGVEDAVAGRLPEDAGQITILESDKIEAVQDAVKAVKRLSVLFVLIALGLYGLAIWLARDRRREAVRSVAASLIIVGIILGIARRLAGNYLVEAITEGELAERTGNETWKIATALIADLGIALIVVGAVTLVCTWLLGPTRAAVAVRRRLAPGLRHHPVLAYGVLALVYLLVILWGPTGSRRLLGVVALGLLLFVTLELLRRRCAREFPESAPDTEPVPDTQPPAPTASAPST